MYIMTRKEFDRVFGDYPDAEKLWKWMVENLHDANEPIIEQHEPEN